MTTWLIGLDLGTSAIKGVLTDEAGHVRARRSSVVRFQRPREGWVELDPEDHQQMVYGVLRDLATAAPAPVAALAFAAASGNTLLTDSHGIPLTPIISWLDRRAEREPPAALDDWREAELRRITGWSCRTSFPLAHLAWLREHQPWHFAHRPRCATNTDWLTWRLTGHWVTDRSTATASHLLDQVRGDYYEPFLTRLGVNRGQLPALIRTGEVIGPLTSQAAEATGLSPQTVLVAGCFDHPAAARAVGVLEPGQFMLSCGTSWVGFLPWADRSSLIAAELLCDPFLSETGGAWGGMFSVPAIGPVIEECVRRHIAPEDSDPWHTVDTLAAQVPPGSGGVTIDLRHGGPFPQVDRRCLSRALMEAAARLVREKLEGLEAKGFRYTEAVMVGGPSQSVMWPAVVAELSGLRLEIGCADAGAVGAAWLAGRGVGRISGPWSLRGHPGSSPTVGTSR